jgi:predicted TIM-barrel fold metal-dependent hydrolase
MRRAVLRTLALLLPVSALPAIPTLHAQTRPLVDHHQHLFSRSFVAMIAPKTPPAPSLPVEVAELVRGFERAVGDSAARAGLYTDDAWLADSLGRTWLRGRDEIVEWWGGAREAPFRLRPVGFSAVGDAAQLTADLEEVTEAGAPEAGVAERDPARTIAHVLLSLRRGPDARWRIAGEAVTGIGPRVEAIDADRLVALMDTAGTRRAAVLSLGYSWGSPNRNVENEREKVRAANDWTGAQVARHPTRLVGFCGVNPLRDYALEEIDRCARDPHLRRGLKLHVGNSVVALGDTAHVAQLRRVFAVANRHRMPIVVHLRSSYSRRLPYGREEARIFLERVLPAATDVPVQIAHLASGGGYDDPSADSVVAYFAERIAAKDPRTRNLWFDVSGVATLDISTATAELVVKRLRQLGLRRVLWGSDGATGGNLPPRQAWAAFRQLPLTDAEFRMIASNVAPWMR